MGLLDQAIEKIIFYKALKDLYDWMFKAETGRMLKDWWWCGNLYELDEFFAVKNIGPIDSQDIVNRWKQKIGAFCPLTFLLTVVERHS